LGGRPRRIIIVIGTSGSMTKDLNNLIWSLINLTVNKEKEREEDELIHENSKSE
jgi:hypothetical protein